ncbi:hypothetical protein Tco_1363948 [Tanacetum coccineum]
MEVVVDQCSVDKNDYKIQIKQLQIDNDQLLNQIMSQDIMHIAMNSVDICDVNKSCVNECYSALDYACKYVTRIQELLIYATQSWNSFNKPSEKLVAVTPRNKEKKVRFTEPVTSSNNISKQTDSLKTKDSNIPLLPSTGVNSTTSASGSKPLGNTKKNRISRPSSSNKKNEVEEHPRTVKSSLNKTNYVSEPISNALVKHSERNAKFNAMCCKCLFDVDHHMCFINYLNELNDVNVRRIFTIVGNRCPLTRITSEIVPLKETTITPVITSNLKVVQIVLWYLEFGFSKHMTENRSQLVNFISKFLGTVRFRNDQIAKIMGMVTIRWET